MFSAETLNYSTGNSKLCTYLTSCFDGKQKHKICYIILYYQHQNTQQLRTRENEADVNPSETCLSILSLYEVFVFGESSSCTVFTL